MPRRKSGRPPAVPAMGSAPHLDKPATDASAGLTDRERQLVRAIARVYVRDLLKRNGHGNRRA